MSTAETMGEAQSTALAPITDALPELRAEVYADVCAWDAARLDLRVGYDAADGEYLAKIQEKLAPASLWHSYLTARHIAPRTAYDRIAKAQGRYVESASKHSNHTVAPGADARRLEETAASLRAAQAREAEARERATRAEEEQVRLNHQLAVAHEAVKRLKGHPSPPSLPSLPSWWPTETTDWVQWGERAEEEAREQAEKRAGRAAHAKPLTPKEQERRERRQAAEEAKRARAEAEEGRERVLRNCEFAVGALAYSFPDEDEMSLLTDTQRQRYAALPPKLIAFAQRLEELLATPSDQGE